MEYKGTKNFSYYAIEERPSLLGMQMAFWQFLHLHRGGGVGAQMACRWKKTNRDLIWWSYTYPWDLP